MIRRIHNSAIICLLAIIAVGFAQFIPPANAQTPLHFGWSSVAPHFADFTGDSRLELAGYNSQEGKIYIRKLNGKELAFDLQIALSGFVVACADYDGDGLADLGSYDRANGMLYAYFSSLGYQLVSSPCAIGTATTEAKPADYDGDGKADPALYDASSGAWIVYGSASGYQPQTIILGGNGATAVPKDYDGDAKADPAVYDQNSGLWSVLCSASQYAQVWVVYGGPGCVAAPEDFDGDGKADPAVYCAALGVWGTLHSASNYVPDVIIQGGPNCVPVPGKYYSTNRANYAVYNTTNGCWSIAYSHRVGGLFADMGLFILKKLFKGCIDKTAEDIVGWTTSKIFHHNDDPDDPHWPEEQQSLSEMNQKLDTLLADQTAIQNQISNLAVQLSYDMSAMSLLIQGDKAQDACNLISTHYDQNSPDSYRTFYQCDTNNPPANSMVTPFCANVRGVWDIENAVSTIHAYILPSATDPLGLLWEWAALATNSITPDNLLDNFAALAYYYGYLYNYQMKGVSMYADACRTMDTNTYSSIATYITNDVVNMIQDEVDLFRTVTYAYVITAIDAAYNPASTNNPLLCTNVAETLADLEFFSRQWMGQTQGLCATFLTVNRPEVISNYNNVMAVNLNDGSTWPVLTVITNQVTGHSYGYTDPDIKHITVANSYVFLRNDFGQVPIGAYALSNAAGYNFGVVTVSNYDDNMNPTNDPTITNRFGHLYASPFNIERLSLPFSSLTGWTANDSVAYYHQSEYVNILFENNPTSLTDYDLSLQLNYNLKHGTHLPSGFGVTPWTYLYGYQFSISNTTAGPVAARVFFTVTDTDTIIQRWDTEQAASTDYKAQAWEWQNCGAEAGFTGGSQVTWAWQHGDRIIYPREQSAPDIHETSTNYYRGMVYSVTPGNTSTSSTFSIGGTIYLIEDCYEGGGHYVVPQTVCFASGEVRFKVQNIIVSFY